MHPATLAPDPPQQIEAWRVRSPRQSRSAIAAATQKREIVLESLGSELTPSEVARKHAISSGQLYTDGGRLVADILRARILAIACGYEDGARGLRCHFGREGLRS
jgi:hypothetical protein